MLNEHPLTGEPIPSQLPHDFMPTGEGLAYERCGFEQCTEPAWSGWHVDSEAYQVTRVQMIEAAIKVLFDREQRASDWHAATVVVDELLRRRGQFEACMGKLQWHANLPSSPVETYLQTIRGLE